MKLYYMALKLDPVTTPKPLIDIQQDMSVLDVLLSKRQSRLVICSFVKS